MPDGVLRCGPDVIAKTDYGLGRAITASVPNRPAHFQTAVLTSAFFKADDVVEPPVSLVRSDIGLA